MRRFVWFSGLVFLALPMAAPAAVGPTTPTFLFAFGHSGSLSAQFFLPGAAVTDLYGNIYVVDSNNDRIQKFDYLGNYLSKWGSSGGSNGQFNTPYGIAIDGPGNIYVLDLGNNRVQKFTPAGAYLSQWGAGGSGPGQFNNAQGIAIDAANNVYVADSGNNRIQKFSTGGLPLAQWGTAGSGNGQFNSPARVAVDPTGNVYVTDFGNNRVQKFTSTGTYLTQWGSLGSGAGFFSGPTGIATDLLGDVYVTEITNNRVQKFSSSGAFLTLWGSAGSNNGQFSGPSGISADRAGNLLVADRGNHRIQKFSGSGVALSHGPPVLAKAWNSQAGGAPWGITTDGTLVYVTLFNANRIEVYDLKTGAFVRGWGTIGTQSGQLQGPTGIAVGPSGKIYVAEFYNNRIQIFSNLGNPLVLWGLPGSGNGFFNSPTGLDVDVAANRLYVADAGNNRIQAFDTSGVYVGQWGGPYGSGDGQLRTPIDVAVDGLGNVYECDRDNHRIQKFTSTGTYLSQFGSLGSGNGQLSHPYSVASGLDGNVHVVDRDNNRLMTFTSDGAYLSQVGTGTARGVGVDPYGDAYVCLDGSDLIRKYVIPPAISLASDVGNDQGRQIQLGFRRSSADASGTGVSVTGYEIYRLIEGVPGAGMITESPSPQAPGWSYLLTVPAHGESEYEVVVPSLADANPTSAYYTSYFVRAATTDPFAYFDGGAGIGYSIDNLPPETPSPFTAVYTAGATNLHWGTSSAEDFSTFRLYRGASADFVPGPGSLVTETPDTGYVDVGDAGSYYKLSAVDRNGNQSAFALMTPSATVAAPEPSLPRRLELANPFPNPMRQGGSFHYALPRAMPIRLALFDVAGRKVRDLVDGVQPAGTSHIEWDGRDDSGRALPSGLLVLRLAADGQVLTQRVLTLR